MLITVVTTQVTLKYLFFNVNYRKYNANYREFYLFKSHESAAKNNLGVTFRVIYVKPKAKK